MNIHCISYQNIGPFADKTVSVNFRQGAHLIKAPIGTGKSFLFFDGPMYALYKSSQRQMLSRTSEKGWIHCIFSIGGSVWYIQRSITSTKSGNDSTKSRLFSLDKTPEEIELALHPIDSITRGDDICAKITTGAEEISFTNQRELESSLQDLLPAKEVVQSVYLMMQDAQHVFELAPAERVTIFKHLFGLLGIDEAKDTLQTRRKEVQGMLTVLDDLTTENNKIQTAMTQLRDAISGIEMLGLTGEQAILREKVKGLPLISDSDLLADSLSIEGLSVNETEIKTLEETQQMIQQRIIAGATLAGSIRSAQQILEDKQKLITQRTNELQQIEVQISGFEKQLGSSSSEEYDKAMKEKEGIINEITVVKEGFDVELFTQCGVTVTTIHEAVSQIESWINEGKTTAKEIEMIELKIQQQQQQEKDYLAKKNSLQEQLKLLTTQYEEQMTFRCDKIEGDCPYVEAIKGAAGRSMQQQRELVEQQLKTLENTHRSDSISLLEEEKKTLESKKKTLSQYLQTVGRKSLIEKKATLEILEKQRTSIDQTLVHLEQQQKETVTIREKIQINKAQQTLLTQQLQKAQNDFVVEKDSLQKLTIQQEQGGYSDSESFLQFLQKITHSHQLIASTVDDYITKKKDKYLLEEELKKLKTLYLIFSKELLVVVLQDFLPQLEEVINAYLSQVASYEVRFLTPTNVDDQLELDITIHDEHGERSVKSLSGGQRALLKICRILAVASLMKSTFLFLDETITSLDAGAVGRVGELIKQFVQKTTMKLYVVTHAQEIQDMNLWEEVVEIESPKKII